MGGYRPRAYEHDRFQLYKHRFQSVCLQVQLYGRYEKIHAAYEGIVFSFGIILPVRNKIYIPCVMKYANILCIRPQTVICSDSQQNRPVVPELGFTGHGYRRVCYAVCKFGQRVSGTRHYNHQIKVFDGPMGSASTIESMHFFPVIFLSAQGKILPFRTAVSVDLTMKDTTGRTSAPRKTSFSICVSAFCNVQKEPVNPKPIFYRICSLFPFPPPSTRILSIVFLIVSAAVSGATFPGRLRAQSTFSPSSLAQSKSIPPG